jgi:hypothetical protein
MFIITHTNDKVIYLYKIIGVDLVIRDWLEPPPPPPPPQRVPWEPPTKALPIYAPNIG